MSANEWGKLTWKLFHTLAAQIDESKFPEYKDKLIELVYSICQNLPCPDCANHASNVVLKRAYTKNIQTKIHFIEFIRQFHNIVNIKLNKKTYTLDEIKDMYTTVNLTDLLNQFYNEFTKRYYNTKFLAHNTKREQFKKPLFIQLNKLRPVMISGTV